MPTNVFKLKTYEDICKADGVDPVASLPFPEAKTDEEKAVNNVAKVFRIIRVLNEGWVPDWTNLNQLKYYPWFYLAAGSSGSWFSYDDYYYVCSNSLVRARLVFKSRELVEHAVKYFLQEYRGWMVIEK